MINAKSLRKSTRSVLKPWAERLTSCSMPASPECEYLKYFATWAHQLKALRTKSQKALWDRLDVLNRKRQSLENAILTSMKTVEIHTSNITSELNAMFDGRIDELEESSTPEG